MRYDGNWHADRREKEGKLTWPNGDVYTGDDCKSVQKKKNVHLSDSKATGFTVLEMEVEFLWLLPPDKSLIRCGASLRT
jgi:hypothetical protein